MASANLFVGFIIWWYSGGYKKIFSYLGAYFGYLGNLFSIKSILKTFFQPWRRLVSERKGGLEGLQNWLIDNLVSRTVGIIMRLFLIVMYLLALVFYALGSVALLLFWTLFPAVIVMVFYVVIGGLNG